MIKPPFAGFLAGLIPLVHIDGSTRGGTTSSIPSLKTPESGRDPAPPPKGERAGRKEMLFS